MGGSSSMIGESFKEYMIESPTKVNFSRAGGGSLVNSPKQG